MREDMFKVVVERPRRGGRAHKSEGRRYRASEDVAPKIGMKQGYVNRKWLNENLAPLKRWLESQANRPWDKVYAELCANIDRRNTVQEHIFAHIENFVERETRLHDGKVFVLTRWGRELQLVDESNATLYVHPLTGVLLKNRHRVTRKQRNKNALQAARAAIAAKRRDLGPFEQLHCVEGTWYYVTLVVVSESFWQDGLNGAPGKWLYPQHWDVLRRQMVCRDPRIRQAGQTALALYGKPDVYAATKRKLSSAELKRYALTNENAGKSRRFHWRRRSLAMVWRLNLLPPKSPAPFPASPSTSSAATATPRIRVISATGIQHWAVNLPRHAVLATPGVNPRHFRYSSAHPTAFPF